MATKLLVVGIVRDILEGMLLPVDSSVILLAYYFYEWLFSGEVD